MKWLGVIAFVILGYVMAFRILVGINNQNHAKMEARKLSEQLILSEQYYDTLVKQVEKIRAYNHDLRYHVETLSGLCAAQDWKGVCEYVESMSCELPKSLPKQYCPVGAANALLQYYAGLCSAEDIEFRCQVYIPQDTQIQPLHLCIILGNGLCNALEAVQKLPKDAQRYIALRVMTEGGKLAISIENPCPTEPQPDQNGGYRTTKRESGHGLGMGNIWEAARHYNGWCKSDWANGIFTLRVMLTEKMAV
jgi:sensor histidine kinase regulating citrate/malate metabolism